MTTPHQRPRPRPRPRAGSGPQDPPAAAVAYLGPPGTFAEQAVCRDPLLAGLRPIPLASPAAVVGQVAAGAAELGVLPWENSVAGVVGASADVLSGIPRGGRRRVRLHRDVVLPVNFDLYGQAGTNLGDVAIVASHPHALAQCQEWVSRRLPGAAPHPTNSTAAALALAAADRSGRTVALAAAGWASTANNPLVIRPDGSRADGDEADGMGGAPLVPLARGVADNPGAETRFVVVGREQAERTGYDRAVVACFQPTDRPRPLLAILNAFAARGIDLYRISSRPTRAGMGRYYFLLECAGHPADPPVRSTLRELAGLGIRTRVLGTLTGPEPTRLDSPPQQRMPAIPPQQRSHPGGSPHPGSPHPGSSAGGSAGQAEAPSPAGGRQPAARSRGRR